MPNRLIHSQSLYLRKHADNPIDWWPWCDEALSTAQETNKPIFLSVGYSSCHWCTVMEGEAFSSSDIATYMNAQYLPIKVDREERPDLDSIYMQALQAMTGQGGWPLNVFLTPGDLVPFYGGTYFPLEPRYGRPAFLQILQAVRNFYDTESTKLARQKQVLLDHLHQTTLLQPTEELGRELLLEGLQDCTAVVARSGYGQSFPMIPYAAIALQGSRLLGEGEAAALDAAQQRGFDLALGGIYDHVAGGFHRYTVDPTWTVPHFEKMLYDNGQIMDYLAQLWSAGVQEPAFERAIAGTVQWLTREMTAAAGYFYAAQDADNFVSPTDPEPEEGRFYVWSYGELEDLLEAEDLTALTEAFVIDPRGNFEQGFMVLQRQRLGPLSEQVESALAKLFAVRYGQPPTAITQFPPARHNHDAKTQPWPGRIPPVTDTKMIVSWNSLMISGLAKAAAVLNQPDYLALATRAARFILEHQWPEGRFQRINYDGQAAVAAQSMDYAYFIKALLDLHQASLCVQTATEAAVWLQAALPIQQEFDEHLWAIEGGYYNTASDGRKPPFGQRAEDLLIRERSWLDNEIPAANGVAIANLVRLALLTENLECLDHAEQALKTFGQVMTQTPTACPSLFAALDWYTHYTLIRTTPDQLLPLVQQRFHPTAVFQLTTDLPAGAVGLVCQGLSCQEPAQDQPQFWQQVSLSQKRGRGE